MFISWCDLATTSGGGKVWSCTSTLLSLWCDIWTPKPANYNKVVCSVGEEHHDVAKLRFRCWTQCYCRAGLELYQISLCPHLPSPSWYRALPQLAAEVVYQEPCKLDRHLLYPRCRYYTCIIYIMCLLFFTIMIMISYLLVGIEADSLTMGRTSSAMSMNSHHSKI